MTRDRRPRLDTDENSALRRILEGTASETGQRFFSALVENLSQALGTHAALVTEYIDDRRRARALAFWVGGSFRDYEYGIEGTPCQVVLEGARLIHHPENVQGLYPTDSDLKDLGAVSYMGVPLVDVDGTVLGHLAVLDTEPMPEEPRGLALFRIFAGRAAAELQRLRAEAVLREREEKLARLLGGAMDAILELEAGRKVTQVNAAAAKAFGCPAEGLIGRDFAELLLPESRERIGVMLDELAQRPEGRRSLWVPGQLRMVAEGGAEFPAEATLSSFEVRRRTFYTIVLRNVNERHQAERKIASLTAEAEYLRERLGALQGPDDPIGRSGPWLSVLQSVAQVAPTDTTVLVLGETGTGKELVARAIHAASGRRGRPLINVNCAALPATLIESELFGHEVGAFTGAIKRRQGRFALADGGTIFLDEVGELPLELQAKLLRVLQEGEIEPLGGSAVRRVDVRVIAATNRNLEQAVHERQFREDLYYRLNVFPIRLPSLRERGDDVVLLAAAFAQRFAERTGRTIAALSEACMQRLRSYSWPGNIRELQNVMERAVITASNGRIDLDRVFPEAVARTIAEPAPADEAGSRIRTAIELQSLERDNIIRALERCDWRVAGDGGAASLLGLRPSTLASRMKSLGISRPQRT